MTYEHTSLCVGFCNNFFMYENSVNLSNKNMIAEVGKQCV